MPISALFHDYTQKSKPTTPSTGNTVEEPSDEESQFMGTRLLGVHMHIVSDLVSRDSADRLKWVFTFVVPLDPHARFLYAKGETSNHTKNDFGTFQKSLKIAPKYMGFGGGEIDSQLAQHIIRQYLKQSVILIQSNTYGELNPDRDVLLVSQEGGPGTASLGGDSAVAAILHVPATSCHYVDLASMKDKTNEEWSESNITSIPTCYIPRVQALQVSIAVVRDVGCHLPFYDYLRPMYWRSIFNDCGKQTVLESDDIVKIMAVGTVQIFDLWKNRRTLFVVDSGPSTKLKESPKFIHYKDAISYAKSLMDNNNKNVTIFKVQWDKSGMSWKNKEEIMKMN